MYKSLLNQIKAIISKDLPLVSNLSNVAALLFTMKDVSWAGFYLTKEDTLYLGPFQGEVACTTIPFFKGVCGTSVSKKETIIVDDVNKFSGHIACSSKSKSEIVTPIIKNDIVKGVIDIDAPIYSRFTSVEKDFLIEVAELLADLF